MPGTGQKDCVRCGGYWFLKTILVFSLAQAEQFPEILLERACHIWQLHTYLHYI